MALAALELGQTYTAPDFADPVSLHSVITFSKTINRVVTAGGYVPIDRAIVRYLLLHAGQ
jgi:hypothetical protein